MASAMSGPTKCSAEPDHGASSTCLPSSRVRRTAGSRAAAAMKRREGDGLAGPGLAAEEHVALGQPDRDRRSRPRRRRGRAAPTAIPAAPGHGARAPRAGPARGSRGGPSRRWSASRTTRTSRAPMVAASDSAASSSCSAVSPGGIRRSQALAGRDRPRCLRPAGSWPWRLITSQATSTRFEPAPRSTGPAASWPAGDEGGRSARRRCRASPRTRIPRPSPSRATPTCQSTKSPSAKATSSPHPRTASAIRE